MSNFTVLALKCGLTTPKIAKNGNFWYKFAHQGKFRGSVEKVEYRCTTTNLPLSSSRPTGMNLQPRRRNVFFSSRQDPVDIIRIVYIHGPDVMQFFLLILYLSLYYGLYTLLFLHFHRLRGSASTVLTATGQVNGRWRNLTPHRIETHEPTATKFRTIDYVRGRTP